jgi:hypothetical protein
MSRATTVIPRNADLAPEVPIRMVLVVPFSKDGIPSFRIRNQGSDDVTEEDFEGGDLLAHHEVRFVRKGSKRYAVRNEHGHAVVFDEHGKVQEVPE